MNLAQNLRGVGSSLLVLAMMMGTVRAIPPPPPDDVRIVRVLDGNTILVSAYGDPFKVRLACLHSLQLQEGSAGQAAKAALESLLQPGIWVTLGMRSKDPEGVESAEIILHGLTVPINLRLLRDGMAMIERNDWNRCDQVSYREAELIAKRNRLGLWARPIGGNQLR